MAGAPVTSTLGVCYPLLDGDSLENISCPRGLRDCLKPTCRDLVPRARRALSGDAPPPLEKDRQLAQPISNGPTTALKQSPDCLLRAAQRSLEWPLLRRSTGSNGSLCDRRLSRCMSSGASG